MELIIELLHENHAAGLLAFELKNRAYFEEMVPGRGEAYYQAETFNERHNDLLEEQEKGLSRFYLIKDLGGSIIGRINLVDIDPVEGKAEVGYRVGEEYTGKGVANEALKLLLDEAVKEKIKQVYAKTTSNNIASQRVLEKNGFHYDGTGDEAFFMHGQPVRFVHYVWP